ncbi:hypothetical protein PR003_g25589 [Phytophthora rubi]|uniref:Uncharacterized protein n=1 Tax=Phytophthora rubi TaxID=129364 RepID=A0A6A4CD63_9STRA|nr:hypothetical protein PR001_g23600 [Phytophthora rubi]KAE9289306.1 hypothetical protein PR003_g25589 [Phytophthora rubi]
MITRIPPTQYAVVRSSAWYCLLARLLASPASSTSPTYSTTKEPRGIGSQQTTPSPTRVWIKSSA